MKRLIPVMVLLLAPFAPVHSRDKKDVERIAALEKQLAEAQQEIDAIDAASRAAFKETGEYLRDLATAHNSLVERVSRMEHTQRSSLIQGLGDSPVITNAMSAVRK